MDSKTLEALKGSIRKWEKIVSGEGVDYGWQDCPLCDMYIPEACRGCPISEKTNALGCRQTPYSSWYAHRKIEHDF
jgi:hypothetical protein